MRDRLFRRRDFRDFANRYVALRLLGGRDTTQESRAFCQRNDVWAFPTVFAMAPDGAVLNRGDQVNAGRPIRKIMEEAEAIHATYRQEWTELEAAGTAREKAAFLARYGRFEAAARLGEEAEREDPTLDGALFLERVYGRLGRHQERADVLARLASAHPSHPDRVRWEIAYVTDHISWIGSDFEFGSSGRLHAALDAAQALRILLGRTTATGDAAVIRWCIAGYFLAADGSERDEAMRAQYQEAARAEYRWILENVIPEADAPRATLALMTAAAAASEDVALLQALLSIARSLAMDAERLSATEIWTAENRGSVRDPPVWLPVAKQAALEWGRLEDRLANLPS